MTEPFTLIAFHCTENELKDGCGDLSALAQALESTAAHRVTICLGVYVFDTPRGWQNIHHLCEFLRTDKRTFVRLPFEAELFARVGPGVGEQLKDLGVTLYPYPAEALE